jgi:hypothetical protein
MTRQFFFFMTVLDSVFSTGSKPVLGHTQPPIQSVSVAISSGLKWPVREGNQSLPASFEVKDVWGCTSMTMLIGWYTLEMCMYKVKPNKLLLLLLLLLLLPLLYFYGARLFQNHTHPAITKFYVDGRCEVDSIMCT